MTETLDTYDTAILKAVSANARITITDLADQINLSKSPTQTRLRRLEKEGFIRGYTAQLNPVKLGLAYIAFVEVKLSDTREGTLTAFNQEILKTPEIEQCHMIAGKFDYLLKIRTSDIQAYRHVLGERVSALPSVAHTSTNVVMEAVKEEAI